MHSVVYASNMPVCPSKALISQILSKLHNSLQQNSEWLSGYYQVKN